MEFKISKCKSCGKEISLNTKSCPNCGDIDPFNRKAIKKLLRVLIVKDNFLALIKGTATFITICFAIYFAWGKSWPYWIVFILIATFFVNIIIDEDEKYLFIKVNNKSNEIVLQIDKNKFPRKILKKKYSLLKGKEIKYLEWIFDFIAYSND
jgi:hypothetical protein